MSPVHVVPDVILQCSHITYARGANVHAFDNNKKKIFLAVAQLDRQDVVRGADCVDSPTLRRTTELLNEGVGGAEREGWRRAEGIETRETDSG